MGSSELHVKSQILPAKLKERIQAIGTEVARKAMGVLGLDVFFRTKNEVWVFHLETRRLCAINLNVTTLDDWRILCCEDEIRELGGMFNALVESNCPENFKRHADAVWSDLVDAFICTCVNEYAEHVSIRGDVESRGTAVSGMAIRDLTSGDALRYMLRFSKSFVFAPSTSTVPDTRPVLDFGGVGFLREREPIFRLQLNCDVIVSMEVAVRMRELIEAEYVNGVIQENKIYGIVYEVRKAERDGRFRNDSDPDRN
jgi:hypothetical protein